MLLVLAGCGRDGIELADGSRADWRDWDGQWLVINYWAEWCAPCREEIPELNRLHRAGQGRNVVVLGINFDGVRGPDLDGLIERFAVEYPVLLEDPGMRWQQPRPSILPTTLIIAPDGRVAEVLVGPQTFESLAARVGLDAASRAPGAAPVPGAEPRVSPSADEPEPPLPSYALAALGFEVGDDRIDRNR